MRELMDTLRGPAKRARPVVLMQAGHRAARFTGRRGGEGPLTTGQRNTLSWVRNENEFARMVDWGLDLPPGATLEDITAALAILLARHESLRTSYPDRDDGPVQHLIQHGELTVDLYAIAPPATAPTADAAPAPAAEAALSPPAAEPGFTEPLPASPTPAELVMALIGRLRSAEFDLTRDLPVRVAVAVDGDVPLAAAASFSHMAADMIGMALVGQQFTELAADPASQPPGEPGHQPLDQAVVEQSRAASAPLRLPCGPGTAGCAPSAVHLRHPAGQRRPRRPGQAGSEPAVSSRPLLSRPPRGCGRGRRRWPCRTSRPGPRQASKQPCSLPCPPCSATGPASPTAPSRR